jgi:SAM-dependent MidA family methyltransferase
MPVIPAETPPTAAPTWRSAWDDALYGATGFFRHQAPAAHFRTSVHASPLFAGCLLELLRRTGLDTVVDVGAGRGELLTALHALDPDLQLLGVEVAPRPADLPPGIDWTPVLPEQVEGVLVANEWLDDIPCHVVEVDPVGVPRMVHVDPGTGEESLGHPLSHAAVPDSLRAWSARWWPLDAAEPGTRAELGTSRDAAWADAVSRLTRGVAIAVDYGHTREGRPPLGSLRSYRDGRQVPVLPDGSRDVTSDIAVDAVAARVDGTALRQHDALTRLGLQARRPAPERAQTDPVGYLRDLAAVGEVAELVDPAGLGGFWWVVSRVGEVADPFTASLRD